MAKVQISETEFHKIFLAERNDDVLIVIPRGDAVSFRGSDIHGELQCLLTLLDQGGFTDIVVDFGSANYFGTTIIGCVTSLAGKIDELGGRMVLCNSSEEMLGVFRVMHLDTRWPHFDSRKIALRALN